MNINDNGSSSNGYQGVPPHSSLVGFAVQAPSYVSAVEFGQYVQGVLVADTWVLDTRTTHHMTHNLVNLDEPIQYNGDDKSLLAMVKV